MVWYGMGNVKNPDVRSSDKSMSCMNLIRTPLNPQSDALDFAHRSVGVASLYFCKQKKDDIMWRLWRDIRVSRLLLPHDP